MTCRCDAERPQAAALDCIRRRCLHAAADRNADPSRGLARDRDRARRRASRPGRSVAGPASRSSTLAGRIVSYDRMDGAPFNSAQHARGQGGLGGRQRPATHEMWAYVANDPQLRLGIIKVQGLSVLGGGVPIRPRRVSSSVRSACPGAAAWRRTERSPTAAVAAILAASADGCTSARASRPDCSEELNR